MLTLCSCKETEKSQETDKPCIVDKTTDEAENKSEPVAGNGESYNQRDFDNHFTKAFTKITYNITTTKQNENDKNRINVTVEVTAVDMTTIFSGTLS